MVYQAEKIKRTFKWPKVRHGFYPRVGEMRNKSVFCPRDDLIMCGFGFQLNTISMFTSLTSAT